MAEKGWTSQAATAAGIAAGTGAAQLGLGYGLGVIAWPVTPAEAESIWLGSLGWATWITASATVLGAVIAGRLRPDRPGRWRVLWRFALAMAAALGALVSVALVALPARAAVRVDTLSPQVVAGGYALAGLLAGLVVAFWAVSSGPVAANLIGTAAWLWALAIAGVAAELLSGRDFATYLTSWQFAESVSPLRYGGIYWPSALLTLVAAFVIGLCASWAAARRGETGLGTAVSGAVGPLLVAFSFLILAPRLTGATGPLQSAYLIAPYAVLAGLAGSAVTVAITRSRHARGRSAVGPAEEANSAEEAGSTGHAGAPLPNPAPTGPPPSVPTGSAANPPAAARPAPAPTAGQATSASTKVTPPAAAGPAAAGPGAAGPGAAGRPARATGRVAPAPAPTDEDTTEDKPPLYLDPEIAAAARPSRNPAKRTTGRKGDNGKPESSAPRSTITPPPANPTVAKINPAISDKPSAKERPQK
ncbi:Hansenula MRAKII killer toxin-resistant protein 1 [Actinoplanes sp. DH11]|uniref:Hansenula MRAKII killer toxin-resistant protein 1 n=1 Tax=Actinoplanes sp. DH11 TaxID=2857011 RepID=UPI001E3057F0|nr:Hansenula MRAKII killer toxin-resistant protein 1 [Actinoplanes sp. DH11]